MTFTDGTGPALVVLPSYGRDGSEDYDDLTARAVADGWRVLRPQPRGVFGSVGPMQDVSLHDLAADVAAVIEDLTPDPVILIGHAFGNFIARLVTTDHPALVRATAIVASQGGHVPERIAKAPFEAGDLSLPEEKRLEILREAFFAPGNDARVWLDGWFPATLAMQRAAIKTVDPDSYWSCGSVPLLEVIPDHDAFKPREAWPELRQQLGSRVTTTVVAGAGHALFPERPREAAEAVLSWARQFR